MLQQKHDIELHLTGKILPEKTPGLDFQQLPDVPYAHERLLLTGLCLRKLSVQFDRVHKFLRDIVYIMTVDMSTISNQKK